MGRRAEVVVADPDGVRGRAAAAEGQSGAAPSAAGIRAGAAAGVAFLAGFGCMAAELTGVRLLAPHFGDSAYVWTNVIGVILAALACGAWFGGRAAARGAQLLRGGDCRCGGGNRARADSRPPWGTSCGGTCLWRPWARSCSNSGPCSRLWAKARQSAARRAWAARLQLGRPRHKGGR